MEKKKILFFISGLNGGGAEKILIDTLKSLNREKYNITLALLEDTGIYLNDVPTHIHFKFLTCKEKPHQKKWFYRFLHHIPFQWIYRFYFPEKYDIEIAFLEGMATHVIGCSTNRKSRKFAWVHTDMMKNRWSDVDFSSEKEQKKIYGHFDEVFCVSKYCADCFVERFGEKIKVSVMYNILCDDEIREKANIHEAHIPAKKRTTLVSSGRFIRQKGFDRLLRVHKRLIDDGYEHDLWLLGDGVMRMELEKYVTENKLEDSVKLLGFQSNPYPFIKSADCFVCSSRAEGFSTAVTEAFILGLPVVSVNCSGAEELLAYGKYGILTENTEECLYNGLKNILGDEDIMEKYKMLALERGCAFSKSKRIQELEEVFDVQ